MISALLDHIERIEAENRHEHWASVPDGTFAKLYAPEHLAKPLFEPGWCRLWAHFDGASLVGHASLFDIGEQDVVGGHISVEYLYRGQRIARKLQGARLAFCDEHGLTLTGPIAPGNAKSAWGCARMGFVPIRVDDNGNQWVARPPRGQSLVASE